MRKNRRILTMLLCICLLVGLALPIGAAGFIGDLFVLGGDNELPIIPITPHTHTWDAGTVTTAPTCTEPGVMTYHCTTCTNGVKTEPINPLGHDAAAVITAPTCTAGGYTTYTCSRCGAVWTDNATDPLGHDYAAVVTVPTCTAGGYTTYTCSRCGDRYTANATEALGHVPGEPVQENEIAPTCITVGGYDTVTYCTVCGAELSRERVRLDALGHTAGEPVREKETAPTCTAVGGYDTAVYCTVCGAELSREHTTLDPLGHTPGEPVRDNETAPSCTAIGGYDTVTNCAVCGAELSREHTELDALGHAWDDGVLTEASGCTSEGVMLFTCTRCGETKTEAISATGHNPGEPAEENRAEPSCTLVGGYDTVTRCTVCQAILSSEHTELPALGHDYQAATTEPTCTEGGFTTYTCSRCGDSYSADETEALGHDFGEWQVTTAPTCLGQGEETRVCTRCEAAETRACPPAGHHFVDGVCTVCGAPDPEYEPPKPVNPFADVPEGEYYYDAVLWAVNAQPQITAGMTADTFGPGKACTRGQVVTFLWRAAGCPEPAADGSPFDDIKADDYYCKAVLWAVENGVTTGTGNGKFSPGQACTRAQVVTFLWRAAGFPVVSANGDANPFTDVKQGEYYYTAVLWAVDQGITTGVTPTQFRPHATCTRGQVVTFLYRSLA